MTVERNVPVSTLRPGDIVWSGPANKVSGWIVTEDPKVWIIHAPTSPAHGTQAKPLTHGKTPSTWDVTRAEPRPPVVSVAQLETITTTSLTEAEVVRRLKLLIDSKQPTVKVELTRSEAFDLVNHNPAGTAREKIRLALKDSDR